MKKQMVTVWERKKSVWHFYSLDTKHRAYFYRNFYTNGNPTRSDVLKEVANALGIPQSWIKLIRAKKGAGR